MVLLLTNRPNFFEQKIQRDSMLLSDVDINFQSITRHDQDPIVAIIEDRQPSLVVFDHDIPTRDFEHFFNLVRKIVTKKSLKTTIGIYEPRYYNSALPDESIYVPIEKLLDTKKFQ